MKDLIKELCLEDLTVEEKNQILVQFTESLLKRLTFRVYDKLSEEDQKEFDRLTNLDDPSKIELFLNSKIPDIEKIREEETNELFEEMKNFLAAAKK